jgi:hypothetical protein
VECVEEVLSVGNGGKKPVKVLLVEALGEESNDSEDVAGVGAEASECGGSKREFDGCGQALVVNSMKYPRPLCVPLPC